MLAWQVQEAKQRFSELINRALREGPQVITRHGREVVVVVEAEEFRRLAGNRADFRDLLLSGPDLSVLPIPRRSPPRGVDL